MEPSLRLITYLVPSHPTELYECIAHFLEEELNVKASLLYESRDPIELFNNRPDPFALNEADIGTSLGASSHQRAVQCTPFILVLDPLYVLKSNPFLCVYNAGSRGRVFAVRDYSRYLYCKLLLLIKRLISFCIIVWHGRYVIPSREFSKLFRPLGIIGEIIE